MNGKIRRGLIGLAAGLISGIALVLTLGNSLIAIALALLVGLGYALASQHTPHTYPDRMMTAAALGVALWEIFSVIVIPVFSGQGAQWTAEGMRRLFPGLVGWVTYGAALGLISQALGDIASHIFLDEPVRPGRAEVTKTRIVILGGGFAGMSVAENLELAFGADLSVDFTLVSETNALLFTPMLAEVAGSSVEPTHISSPLRTSLRRTRVIRGRATGIDETKRTVTVLVPDYGAGVEAERLELVYDHLVLALGSVSNYLGMKNVEELAYDFKTLVDAIRIRNRVIELFDSADRTADAARRNEMLTFVVAGGGFAGVELAGALNDFARGMLAQYPNLDAGDVRIILVHSRERILPELSEPLAVYAQERLTARRVIFKLNARLVDAHPGLVVLKPQEEIRARTLIWTAGVAPNPLLKSMSVERDRRGAVIVDHTLAVPGHQGIWALGDCAAIADVKTGKPCPPTAQFALREARTLARNIRSSLKGKPLQPFHFDSLGALCVIGHQTACAELAVPFAPEKKARFSGLLAWMMWRAVYVSKLPGRERKLRVLVDWIIELFFPRDIVQTIDFNERPVGAEKAKAPFEAATDLGRAVE